MRDQVRRPQRRPIQLWYLREGMRRRDDVLRWKVRRSADRPGPLRGLRQRLRQRPRPSEMGELRRRDLPTDEPL